RAPCFIRSFAPGHVGAMIALTWPLCGFGARLPRPQPAASDTAALTRDRDAHMLHGYVQNFTQLHRGQLRANAVYARDHQRIDLFFELATGSNRVRSWKGDQIGDSHPVNRRHERRRNPDADLGGVRQILHGVNQSQHGPKYSERWHVSSGYFEHLGAFIVSFYTLIVRTLHGDFDRLLVSAARNQVKPGAKQAVWFPFPGLFK